MLTGSSSTSSKLRTNKGTLLLVGFVFVFLITSVAIGLRTSNAALPVSAGRGCHGGEGQDVVATCTSSSSSSTTTVGSSTSSTSSSASSTDSSTTVTTTVSTSTIASTTSGTVSGGPSGPVAPVSPSNCNALTGINFQALPSGTNLTIAFNGNGQMTFTVPSEKSFTWNWYFVAAGGMSTSALGQQITTTMWANGHGQDFSFFVAQLNGQTGLVLQTDYSLSQACG